MGDAKFWAPSCEASALKSAFADEDFDTEAGQLIKDMKTTVMSKCKKDSGGRFLCWPHV